MQYTTHYNLNLPEGTDIVNPLIQDNPNYSAIDTALYNNKLRVIGTSTHVKTGTNHAITLGDSDINQFKFVATGDYVPGDTFTVDGVTVTAKVADGSSIPAGAFKINSTVLCILDGTILNLMNVYSNASSAADISYDGTSSGLSATNVQDAIDELATNESATASGLSTLKTSVEKNNLDTPFQITTPLGTPYQLLADGYLNLRVANTADSVSVRIYGSTDNFNFFTMDAFMSATVILNNTVFLRKGMRVVKISETGSPSVEFIPLKV